MSLIKRFHCIYIIELAPLLCNTVIYRDDNFKHYCFTFFPRCLQSTFRSSGTSEERVSTNTQVVMNDTICHTPREANTNLLDFINQSDIQKRRRNIDIPFFTPGSYLAVTQAYPHSPTGTTKFVGICIARRNKGLGSTFILRNVINGVGVEVMYELYSPAIREIEVLKLERRRRAKLYYLQDKPLKYSTVSDKMQPVPNNGEPTVYKRKKGAPA